MEQSEAESQALNRIKGNLPAAIERAIEIVGDLTAERRTTKLSIPPRPEVDEDLVLIQTLEACRDRIAELEVQADRLRAAATGALGIR